MPDFPLIGGGVTPYADMTLSRGIKHAISQEDREVLYALARRVNSIKPWQDRLRAWSDRADALYLAENFTDGGADLWSDDDSAKINGRVHISVNLPEVYVAVPSALQAVTPIENMVAIDTDKASRQSAANQERLYSAWKRAVDFDLKWHQAITTKSLYGQTAMRIYWDPKKGPEGEVCAEVIDQPKNLHLGYKTDDYQQLEWAAYVTRYEPNALIEQYGVDVQPVKADGVTLPLVTTHDWATGPARPYLSSSDERVE